MSEERKMTAEEKLELLKQSIWYKREVDAYYDYRLTPWGKNKLYSQIRVQTQTPKMTVFRDEILRINRSSVEQETKNILLAEETKRKLLEQIGH